MEISPLKALQSQAKEQLLSSKLAIHAKVFSEVLFKKVAVLRLRRIRDLQLFRNKELRKMQRIAKELLLKSKTSGTILMLIRIRMTMMDLDGRIRVFLSRETTMMLVFFERTRSSLISNSLTIFDSRDARQPNFKFFLQI